MTPAESAYQKSAAAATSGDDLVTQEISQVYYIATRIRERLPQQVDLEDLVSAGVVGLLEAARSFDRSKDVLFRTFAKFRIQGAIMDSLRQTDWGSRYVRRKGREISEVTSQLQSSLGRQPSESEIAQKLGLEIERFQKLVAQIDSLQLAGQRTADTDTHSGSVDLIELAPNLTDPDPLELCLRGERKALLAEAISRLSEREQTILSLYYREEITMKEIAEVIGVSVSRVCQLHDSILAKLKVSLEDLLGNPSPDASIAGEQHEYA